MHDEPGRTVSIWMSEDIPQLLPISTGAHADVCVVGAGIAGIRAASAHVVVRESTGDFDRNFW